MRSTHRADRVPGRLFHHLFPELSRREITQPAMGLDVVVMLEQESNWRSTLAALGFALTRA
jgi:hypothetical protein